MRRREAAAVALAFYGGFLVAILPGLRGHPWAPLLGVMFGSVVLLASRFNGDWW